jgi:hypothetical protein
MSCRKRVATGDFLRALGFLSSVLSRSASAEFLPVTAPLLVLDFLPAAAADFLLLFRSAALGLCGTNFSRKRATGFGFSLRRAATALRFFHNRAAVYAFSPEATAPPLGLGSSRSAPSRAFSVLRRHRRVWVSVCCVLSSARHLAVIFQHHIHRRFVLLGFFVRKCAAAVHAGLCAKSVCAPQGLSPICSSPKQVCPIGC